jgi:predicted porin
MKRTLIALAIAASVAVPVAAQAAPKVYGKLNLTVENIDDDTKLGDYWNVISNASRFGVKGEDELTASLSAVYQIEWGVSGEGNATDMEQRNRFVGIKSNDFGTIKLGKYDTYLKLAQGEIDQFNDLNADLGKVMAGENRVNNVIGYESPKILDAISINLMVMPGEENGAPNAIPGAANDDSGIADSMSASIVYNNEDMGLFLALAFDKDVVSTFNAAATFAVAPAYVAGSSGGTFASDKTNITRLVASYTLKDLGLSLGALYQMAERSEGATIAGVADLAPEEKGMLLSAAFKFAESWTAKAQYASSTSSVDVAGASDVDLTQMSLGLDYGFTAKTKAFGYYSIRNHSNGNNPTVVATGKTDDYDISYMALGLEHKF